ncbi:TPA: purine permease [Aeromonas salmonicida]|uniref:nucleobase:cation symporter-2 family protein n=1 Tax=Aeromonas salmonicida TaxID=645 RepID=UPI00044FD42E|nr:nucleobase:cation symporter-2 family protein [Aeromonas salmonicida]ELI6436169.1 purine permease [Aeromonas salmonicida subsp. salmonicida]ASI22775.1 xanthine permease XanP [Aeromonas salmonicida]ASI27091.1 xanthine permease XanP [Aeromonas salmonicida]ASI31208.1 xanthine permease XanP [Aeromonas salmonicida]ATD39740.1 xanthine permease XanP [Aeromonas salmonicida subsp. masoucida]
MEQAAAARATREAHPPRRAHSELVYGIDDVPPLPQTLFAALQHMLAMFVAIITPPLIIANALGLPAADTRYIVSMSLVMSGIASFIQTRRFGPIGSGLLSVQGTSFNFLGPIIASGLALKQAAMPTEDLLGTLFGTMLVAALTMVVMSRFLHLVKQVITPLVTGIVVLLIGLTLIKVGLISMGGGYAALSDGSFASHSNLFLSLLVLGLIVLLQRSRNPWLRLSAIMIAMLVGYAAALILGKVTAPTFDGPLVMVPIPLHYGLGFDWQLFVPLAIIFVVTALEAIGDMTATSDISGEPLKGPVYMARIKGGVLADGANSMLAAVFSTFPMSTFAQNNGVIQLTGVASRHVGLFIAAMLALLGLLGLFPAVASLVQQIPEPVLGGATIVMFGTIAAAGVRIISREELDRRALMILAVSLAMGLGVAQVPEVLQHLPELAKSVLSYGVATGGLTAIIMNLLLPKRGISHP